MAFQGGPLSVLGITPSYLGKIATQTLSSGVQAGVGQVWQGAGQSFSTAAGQQLTGVLADSALNIAINTLTGQEVENIGGVLLDAGKNVLAPSITPYITGTLASQINRSIKKSLESAGPFGPILSSAATKLTRRALGGISATIDSTLFGGGDVEDVVTAAAGPSSTNYKMFPGGGGEPAADYGGSSYTLTDVVFSLQPANQGPQAFGDYSAAFDPKFGSKLPFGDLINADFSVEYPAVNSFKQSVMKGNFLGDVVRTNTGLA